MSREKNTLDNTCCRNYSDKSNEQYSCDVN